MFFSVGLYEADKLAFCNTTFPHPCSSPKHPELQDPRTQRKAMLRGYAVSLTAFNLKAGVKGSWCLKT